MPFRTQKLETGRSKVQGHPLLNSWFMAILGWDTLFQDKTNHNIKPCMRVSLLNNLNLPPPLSLREPNIKEQEFTASSVRMKSEVLITSGMHGSLLLVILGFGRWRQDQESKVILCRECRVSLCQTTKPYFNIAKRVQGRGFVL